MNQRPHLCAGIALLLFNGASATQWTVGPGQLYTAPSQVAALVSDGDTVNIQAGTYPSDVTNWTANDLLWAKGAYIVRIFLPEVNHFLRLIVE